MARCRLHSALTRHPVMPQNRISVSQHNYAFETQKDFQNCLFGNVVLVHAQVKQWKLESLGPLNSAASADSLCLLPSHRAAAAVAMLLRCGLICLRMLCCRAFLLPHLAMLRQPTSHALAAGSVWSTRPPLPHAPPQALMYAAVPSRNAPPHHRHLESSKRAAPSARAARCAPSLHQHCCGCCCCCSLSPTCLGS